MEVFILWKLQNPDSVYGYEYILISESTNKTFNYSPESHLSFDAFGYGERDLECVHQDYEKTSHNVHLPIKEFIAELEAWYSLHPHFTSLTYYIDKAEMVMVAGMGKETYRELNLEVSDIEAETYDYLHFLLSEFNKLIQKYKS